MVPANAADLANAPILGLLAVIALSLITLVGMQFASSRKQSEALVNMMLKQGESTSDTLRDEVMQLRGQIQEQSRMLRSATEDAIRAKLEAGRLQVLYEDAVQDRQSIEKERDEEREARIKMDREIKALKKYVKLLVDVMREHKIPVPGMEEGVSES
jgi:multidrug efflux pump subunit AcrB